MKTIKLLSFFVFASLAMSFTILSPMESDNRIVLSSLTASNSSIEKAANGIEEYISKTSHGYLWPVSKMVFSKQNDKLIVTVTAIDNSWFQLFGVGEKPYGYLIAKGRLYIVSSAGDDDFQFAEHFRKTGTIRAFSRPQATIALFKESPTWVFELKNGELKEISKSNLDLLSKGDPEY